MAFSDRNRDYFGRMPRRRKMGIVKSTLKYGLMACGIIYLVQSCSSAKASDKPGTMDQKPATLETRLEQPAVQQMYDPGRIEIKPCAEGYR